MITKISNLDVCCLICKMFTDSYVYLYTFVYI